MEDSGSIEDIVFLSAFHLCKKKNERGDWVSCITSNHKNKGLVLITDSENSPSVIYVKYCPFCGKEK